MRLIRRGLEEENDCFAPDGDIHAGLGPSCEPPSGPTPPTGQQESNSLEASLTNQQLSLS